jgi:hypothetical protein
MTLEQTYTGGKDSMRPKEKLSIVKNEDGMESVRCFCRFKTLLGKVGRNEKGVFFEKKYRQYIEMRVYGECLVEVKCPSCFRVHKITIKACKDIQNKI